MTYALKDLGEGLGLGFHRRAREPRLGIVLEAERRHGVRPIRDSLIRPSCVCSQELLRPTRRETRQQHNSALFEPCP